MESLRARWIAPWIAFASSACVLAPEGLEAERARLDQDGAPYAKPAAERTLPPLSGSPGYPELSRRALLADPGLEAAWQRWRAALERVDVEATWPAPNLELELEHMLPAEGLSAFDRTSVRLGFEPSMPLELPAKTALRGEVALDEARMARAAFRARYFALERRFGAAWVMWTRLGEEVRAAERSLEFLRASSQAAERMAAVEPTALGPVRVRLEIAEAENMLATLRAEVARAEVEVRALAELDERTPLPASAQWPDLPVPPLSDEEWFALAARSNPMLAEFAASVAGRSDALELARRSWWPDVAPFAGFTGSLTEFVGAAIMIPTRVPALRAAVREARARLDEVQALEREGQRDVRAGLTADLIALREAERARRFTEETLVPLAEQLSELARNAYAGGALSQMEWLDALRAENEARVGVALARAAREESLLGLQEWSGVELATLARKTEVGRE